MGEGLLVLIKLYVTRPHLIEEQLLDRLAVAGVLRLTVPQLVDDLTGGNTSVDALVVACISENDISGEQE